MNSKIAVGQTFPDFELPDHTKTLRRLSDLQGRQDPMLVVLIRGFFCPKDREQLKELTRFHPQLVVGSCHLVVITTTTGTPPTTCASNSARAIHSCTTKRSACATSWTSWNTPTPSTSR